jgi:hypothetical protein
MPIAALCFFIAGVSMGTSAFAGLLTLACMVWAAYRVFWGTESRAVMALEPEKREIPWAMAVPMVAIAALIKTAPNPLQAAEQVVAVVQSAKPKLHNQTVGASRAKVKRICFSPMTSTAMGAASRAPTPAGVADSSPAPEASEVRGRARAGDRVPRRRPRRARLGRLEVAAGPGGAGRRAQQGATGTEGP